MEGPLPNTQCYSEYIRCLNYWVDGRGGWWWFTKLWRRKALAFIWLTTGTPVRRFHAVSSNSHKFFPMYSKVSYHSWTAGFFSLIFMCTHKGKQSLEKERKILEKKKHVSVLWVVLCLRSRAVKHCLRLSKMSVTAVNMNWTTSSAPTLLYSSEEELNATLLYINSSSTITTYFNSSDVVATNALDSLMNVLIAMVLVILILTTAIGKWIKINTLPRRWITVGSSFVSG